MVSITGITGCSIPVDFWEYCLYPSFTHFAGLDCREDPVVIGRILIHLDKTIHSPDLLDNRDSIYTRYISLLFKRLKDIGEAMPGASAQDEVPPHY